MEQFVISKEDYTNLTNRLEEDSSIRVRWDCGNDSTCVDIDCTTHDLEDRMVDYFDLPNVSEYNVTGDGSISLDEGRLIFTITYRNDECDYVDVDSNIRRLVSTIVEGYFKDNLTPKFKDFTISFNHRQVEIPNGYYYNKDLYQLFEDNNLLEAIQDSGIIVTDYDFYGDNGLYESLLEGYIKVRNVEGKPQISITDLGAYGYLHEEEHREFELITDETEEETED